MSKLVLITGSAKRIGSEIARYFADRQWRVCIHANQNEAAARALLATLPAPADGCHGIVLGDLAAEGGPERLMRTVFAQCGPLDCLVNNASLFSEGSIETCSERDLLRNAQVNFLAPVLLIQSLYNSLPASARASVINITDQKVVNLNNDCWAYTFSKISLHASLLFLAQSTAAKLRINEVAPGLTLPSAEQTPEQFAQIHQRTPTQRGSTPLDIARAVFYFAENELLTGQSLVVDGGQHLVPSLRDVMYLTGGKYAV